MTTVGDAVREILNPIRKNDLKARRRKLGLSHAALGRIFGVDRATVLRHEKGVLSSLWDYAMRGVEAEAQERKQEVRSFKSELDLQSFMPDQLAARGLSYTAEKMREDQARHARTKWRPPRPSRTDRPVDHVNRGRKAEIKAIADRAETRSRLKVDELAARANRDRKAEIKAAADRAEDRSRLKNC
jgi:hypothetical protein